MTGHTGFKGAWLALWLERLGAHVTGYALAPDTDPNLSSLLAPWANLESIIGDVGDAGALAVAIGTARPEIVFHMAAQALVRRGYSDPVGTFATNIQGTINLLEALGQSPDLQAIVVVTSDKCYANHGHGRPFVETDPLGGKDPYSASKAAQDIVAQAWHTGVYGGTGPALATARAGNVIGGGDWAEDRLLPDIFRAVARGETLQIRNPAATRPWQHVLEPLAGYMALAEALATQPEITPGALNFGPAQGDVIAVSAVVERVAGKLQEISSRTLDWSHDGGDHPAEAPALALDAALAAKTLGWRPRLGLEEALDWTAEWYLRRAEGEDARGLTSAQIAQFEAIADGS